MPESPGDRIRAYLVVVDFVAGDGGVSGSWRGPGVLGFHIAPPAADRGSDSLSSK